MSSLGTIGTVIGLLTVAILCVAGLVGFSYLEAAASSVDSGHDGSE